MWIFENLSNWGRGGSKLFQRSSRWLAEDLAHEQLRGWYQSATTDQEHTIYYNSKGIKVGEVRLT